MGSEHDVRRLLDSQRAHEAADARSRERWLRQQSAEEATLTGVLVAAAERDMRVALRTVTGRSRQGSIVGVGVDFVRVRVDHGPDVLVALTAIAVVTPLGSVEPISSAGGRTADLTLAEALGRVAPEHPAVTVWCSDGGSPIVGTLRSVGRDVVVVNVDGEQATHCHVALPAVVEVTVTPG